jgi:flavin-dependent dehydrogenase
MAKSRKTEKNLPIAIIGGGPAGLSAAIAAAAKYKNVVLYDKSYCRCSPCGGGEA